MTEKKPRFPNAIYTFISAPELSETIQERWSTESYISSAEVQFTCITFTVTTVYSLDLIEVCNTFPQSFRPSRLLSSSRRLFDLWCFDSKQSTGCPQSLGTLGFLSSILFV